MRTGLDVVESIASAAVRPHRARPVEYDGDIRDRCGSFAACTTHFGIEKYDALDRAAALEEPRHTVESLPNSDLVRRSRLLDLLT